MGWSRWFKVYYSWFVRVLLLTGVSWFVVFVHVVLRVFFVLVLMLAFLRG